MSQGEPLNGLLDRLSERQMALLVILFGLVLYLPFAGTYGLWDPWETHYGEVARQMTARHDYISLWWPGSPIDAEPFWSKPVLSFWLMSLSMHLAGIGGASAPPGQVSLWWALAFHTVNSIGFANVLPVSLALYARAAPRQVAGMMIAVYYVHFFMANFAVGKLGGLLATQIINYPEVAILGVHQIKQRPVVRDGQLAVGEIMLLSLSFDHRVIDGHVGAAFAYEVISYLEDPDRFMLEL